MYYTDNSILPEYMAPLIITAAPFGPQWLPGGCRHSRHLGGASPDGSGLLQRRRHGAARPCTQSRHRKGIGRLRSIQLFLGSSEKGRAEDDPPGRRLDLVLSENRRCESQVAELRHAPHADGTGPEAGVRHGCGRHDTVGHHLDDGPGGCRGDSPCRSQGAGRLGGHGGRCNPGLLPGASQAAQSSTDSTLLCARHMSTSSKSSSG